MSNTTVAEPPPAPIRLASREYRDPATLTRWLKRLLILSVAVDLIVVGSGVMEFAFLQSFVNGTLEGDIDALANANDNRQQAISFAQLALYAVTAIVFLTWIYRANRNARALGAKNMRFTPGWAVVWFFVPVMSLWRPFQVMREIWQASAEPGNWQSAKTPSLLGWWWALFLCAQILGQIGFQLSKKIDSVDSAMTASGFITASDIAGLPLDIVAMLLVMKIAAHQIWQAKTVEVF